MSRLLSLLPITCSFTARAQEPPPPDSALLRRIDSLVAVANAPGHTVSRDSSHYEMPEMKMSSRTWLTLVLRGKEVLKYVNRVTMHSEIGGVRETNEGENIFYFEKGSLVKVDEWFMKGGKRHEAHWYFHNDRAVHYTPQYPKSAERAAELPKLADAMMAQWRKMGLE